MPKMFLDATHSIAVGTDKGRLRHGSEPARFRPVNDLVNLDDEANRRGLAGGAVSLSTRNDRTSQFIGALSESIATQLFLAIDELPASTNRDAEACVTRIKRTLAALRLPPVDGFKVEYLADRIAKNRQSISGLLRERLAELDLLDETDIVVPGKFTSSPSTLRNYERHGVIVPNLFRCLDAHFSQTGVGDGKRCLLDIGAWDGRLTSILASRFTDVVALEPDPERFRLLEDRFTHLTELPSGECAPKHFAAHPWSLQTVVDTKGLIRQIPDVILLSHVLYFVQDGGYDFKALDWAMETLAPNGILAIVLNDPERRAGTRAHFRDHLSADEAHRDPRDYCEHLSRQGICVDYYKVQLQLRAQSVYGRNALHELMFYMLPGSGRRMLPGAIQSYTSQHQLGETDSKTVYGLDHQIAILIARKRQPKPSRARVIPGRIEMIRAGTEPSPEPATTPEIFTELSMPAPPMEEPKKAARGEVLNPSLYQDIQEVWAMYKDPNSRGAGSDLLRNTLMVHYLPIVRFQAERIHVKLPEEVELDDLMSAGIFGLKDAVEAFDLDRGIKFETYAAPRIRGAIFDELRSMDWVPRLVRSRAAKLQRVIAELEIESGVEPTEEEVAKRMNLSSAEMEKFQKDGTAVTQRSLSRQKFETDSGKKETVEDGIPAMNIPLDARMLRAEVREFLYRGLSPVQAEILRLLIERGETLAAVGASLDLSESRMSQVCDEIVGLLKAKLSAPAKPGDLLFALREEERLTGPGQLVHLERITSELARAIDSANEQAEVRFRLGNDASEVTPEGGTFTRSEKDRLNAALAAAERENKERSTGEDEFGFKFV